VRRPFPPALLAVALLASCCSGEEPHATPRAGAPAFAEPLPSLPVENAARIADGVYRGAQPDAAGLKALKELGVRTVVSFRSHHSERKEAEALGLEVVEIPMQADIESEPPTDADVRRFFEVVLDPAKRPVYFHCAKGKDRTGTMAALYRMEVDGWSNEDAIAEMERFGYHDYYKDLIRFLREYRPRGFRPPAK
jgi:protein tyrosine phosphatase (PTP) superfamily phosphohydrolase (DUF442 family)